MESPQNTINPPSFPDWVSMNWAYDERREEFRLDKSSFDAYTGIADAYYLFEAHELPQSRSYEDEFKPIQTEEKFEEVVDASDFELCAEFRRRKSEEDKGKTQRIYRAGDKRVEVEVKLGEGKDEQRAAASQATFVRSPSGQPTPEGATPDAEPPRKA